MTIKTSLLCSAALGVACVLASSGAASAAPKHKAPAAAPNLSEDVKALRAEVQALEAKLEQSQQQAQAQIQAAQADAAAAQEQARVAKAAVDNQILTIPGQVATAVASQPKARPDNIPYKDVSITLGGFLAAESIYRSKNETADISSSFNAIPLANNKAGHTQELRGTARQSRISALVQGSPNPTTHLALYGEFDFQGAAQTANSNQSNSYNPRIRHLYGTVDWDDLGLHLLAGQNWSLVTMNTKGITPRNELTPPQIDAQYVPGFAWARQPQVRITKDFDKTLWLALSLENPQTTFFTVGTGPGAGTLPSSLTFNATGGSGFNSANSLSFNHVPDVVGKVAYEAKLGDIPVHLEAFGVYRDFYARAFGANHDESGGGFGAGIVVSAIPKVLDLQVSGLTGKGIGRYGSSQLPDVTFDSNGNIHPIEETMLLAGGTLHATPKLDLYVFGGQERSNREAFNAAGGAFGYGNVNYVNLGCFSETSTAACNGNTKSISQVTAGFWNKIYSGSYGRAQVGIQYSYTKRDTFSGVGGAPSANENMVFTSFRYYPF